MDSRLPGDAIPTFRGDPCGCITSLKRIYDDGVDSRTYLLAAFIELGRTPYQSGLHKRRL